MRYTKSKVSEKNIMDAALLLVRQKGFTKTSIRDICKAAGVSTGAFYHYFKTKDQLLGEAFINVDEALAQSYEKYDSMPPLEALKAVLVDQTAYTVSEGCPVITEYYRALLQGSQRSAISPQRGYYKAVLKYVEKAQKDGRLSGQPSAEIIAHMLIKYVRGCLIDWCLHDGAYDAPGSVSKELDIALAALKPSAAKTSGG